MAKHRGNKATVEQLEALNIDSAFVSTTFANCIEFAGVPGVYLTVGDGAAVYADDNGLPVRKIVRGSPAAIANHVKFLLDI